MRTASWDSFRQGVDLPGEARSNVVTRLPFSQTVFVQRTTPTSNAAHETDTPHRHGKPLQGSPGLLPGRRQQVDAVAARAHPQADGPESFRPRVPRRMAARVDVDGPHAAVAQLHG